jgi:TonB family protein
MFWLIANLLVRSSLILGAGALLSRWFPCLRPAQRHAILVASFLLLLLWPLLAALLPEVSLSVGTQSPTVASVTVEQFAVGHRTAQFTKGFVFSPVALWAAAACLSFAPLLIAHLRLRRLLKSAVVCQDAGWNTLFQELCSQLNIPKTPVFLIHPGSIMPMASGVLRTSIVLPNDCHSWTPLRRRVVLLHELAHISRRDLLSQSIARFITAVWWFQPLSWGALRLLRGESERACDELVIGSGMRPSDYATELLTIAKSFSASGQAWTAGIAMARPDGLEIRLNSILQAPNTRSPSSLRIAVSLVCLTALTIAASAVTPSSKSQSLSPRGHIMKHTLFTGLLASAGLTAATIGGSLYDPSGAAVPNAKALLYDPDTNSKFETTTTADGRFAFETLPAGQYILRVQSPGFATLFREFNVKADSKVDRGLTLSLGKVKETVNVSASGVAAPAVSTQPKRIRVGGAVEQANLTTKIQPIYPTAAKAAHVQGTVELEMVVSKEGEPLDLRVLASPSDDLTQSALEAVRQWRYKPTLLNGAPVEIVTDVVVNYTLTN